MKKIYLLIFCFISSFLFSQSGFYLNAQSSKISIPFQLSNNLIVIEVKINGVALNFLLDTGVENTILFSFEDAETPAFKDVEKIKIRGLGTGQPIEALRTKNNQLAIKNFVDNSHEVYIILDQEVNFSTQLGIPVHGIIGYHFFKNHFIEINYKSKKLYIYQNQDSFSKKKLKKYKELPLSIDLEKPYITLESHLNDKIFSTKLLIDSGSSDAIWLFENEAIKVPTLSFDDYLGRGFSGDIFGKRSRMNAIEMGDIKINNPTVSFPEKQSLEGVDLVNGRNGTLGSAVLKRFNVLLDYKNRKIFLQKNSNFNEPFNYNMSGIDVEHSGLQYVEEKVELSTSKARNEIIIVDEQPTRFKYQFVLRPLYSVSNIRANSPASNAGLQKGDIIKKINSFPAYRYKLDEIVQLFQSEEGIWITIEYERKGKLYTTKFQLKKVL